MVFQSFYSGIRRLADSSSFLVPHLQRHNIRSGLIRVDNAAYVSLSERRRAKLVRQKRLGAYQFTMALIFSSDQFYLMGWKCVKDDMSNELRRPYIDHIGLPVVMYSNHVADMMNYFSKLEEIPQDLPEQPASTGCGCVNHVEMALPPVWEMILIFCPHSAYLESLKAEQVVTPVLFIKCFPMALYCNSRHRCNKSTGNSNKNWVSSFFFHSAGVWLILYSDGLSFSICLKFDHL